MRTTWTFHSAGSLVFGRDVDVRINAINPRGVRAEAEFPAIRST